MFCESFLKEYKDVLLFLISSSRLFQRSIMELKKNVVLGVGCFKLIFRSVYSGSL